MRRTTFYKRYKMGLALFPALALVFTLAPTPIMAAPGGVIHNGSNSGDPPGQVPANGFLFEPEVPLASLKTVPTWNELEQLLDNPYLVELCSSSTSTFPLVQNTPGTTQIIGSPTTPIYPAYCSKIIRRPGFGVTLPPLLVHPLNYNPTDGEEMRLLNPRFRAGPWRVPAGLVQCSSTDPDDLPLPVRCDGTLTVNDSTGAPVTTLPFSPDRWVWKYEQVQVSSGARVLETEIDYNAPLQPDVAFQSNTPNTPGYITPTNASIDCVVTTEVVPPEGSTICGGDTGEPGYAGFGVLSPGLTVLQYSTPAVPGVGSPGTAITTQKLFDPMGCGTRNAESPGSCAGGGFLNRLRKPTIRPTPTSAPNYLMNTDPNDVTPSNENDYVRNREVAAALGKSLFWDMQVGSDAVQSCGSCHVHAGADNRTKNQLNPNHLGGDVLFEVQPPNGELVASDFPFQKLTNPEIAGDPKCSPTGVGVITASVNAGVLENPPPLDTRVCDAGNVVSDKNNSNGTKVVNDVASSMGVHFGRFLDIPTPGPSAFGPSAFICSGGPTPGKACTTSPAGQCGTGGTCVDSGVRSVLPDLRSTVTADNFDPIPGFQGTDGSGHGIRRVEPRNTPTIFAAALNFDNFWDGRARHDFNGGSVFGAADPQNHVFVNQGILRSTRQIIRFASLASLATGPGLSEFEMSFLGRNWAKIGKKLLQAGVTPLANQLVATTDSVLGPYSNQGGSACASLPAADRSPGSPTVGKPGLCITYPALIRQAFYPPLYDNTNQHLNGCYTDSRPDIHPNQCAATVTDPFDGYVLTPANGAAAATNTNQFTQMEGNFSLFWGLSVDIWVTLLMPDNTPYDQFLDQNPDMFESIGEVGEPGLVGPLPTCTNSNQRHCFREVGHFKRDASFTDPDVNNCKFLATGEGSTTLVTVAPCKGTRVADSNTPDPLLGMDIFQGSNLSLKNPNFRAARCGECHAGSTLTDNTMPFTFKAQLGDFIGEFLSIGNEALVEPLGRTRVISGSLLESEMNENGQDAVERRMINQSIAPFAADGLAYPDGLVGPDGIIHTPSIQGAGQAFFDNGVYNLGVTRCEANQSTTTGVCDDIGRGGDDAFGWPLSLATLMLKNLGGPAQQPGTPLLTFDPSVRAECAPECADGGLFEETAQDENINPGFEGGPVNPLLPPYLARWASQINVGDSMPELDDIRGRQHCDGPSNARRVH